MKDQQIAALSEFIDVSPYTISWCEKNKAEKKKRASSRISQAARHRKTNETKKYNYKFNDLNLLVVSVMRQTMWPL